ncbi:MAG: hypothetical protein QOD51_2729, partial [Candidatus Eremiobacteraeota bacterium]|nr:hypothetical protein [Candidatus Eremiobacteraeota bacterium]
MRKVLGGIAVLALAAASASVAVGMPATGSMMMPKCAGSTGPVVWWMASTKMYYAKGAPQYGKGSGKYACRATAMKAGGKMGATTKSGGAMGGSMSPGSTGTGSSGGAMSPAMTMAPRPASTSGTMGSGSTG